MSDHPGDVRAEGHREGVADGLTYVANWLHRTGKGTKSACGYLLGLAHLARRGVDLPALPAPETGLESTPAPSDAPTVVGGKRRGKKRPAGAKTKTTEDAP